MTRSTRRWPAGRRPIEQLLAVEEEILVELLQVDRARATRLVTTLGILERVMNLGENRIGMRILWLAHSPAVPRFPHS